MPCDVICACGQIVHGERWGRHRTVRCPACGGSVFLFPRSPWPAPDGAPPAKDIRATSRKPGPPWHVPLLAGALSVVLVALLFLALRPMLSRPAAQHAPDGRAAREFHKHLAAGERALAEGNFRVAHRELNEAAKRRDQHPGLIGPLQDRRLIQLQRQSDLLAHLLNRSLEEITREAARLRSDEEWQERFAQEYRGKSVLFDDVVRRDRDGRPVLGYYAVEGSGSVRVALEDLKLFRQLPLDPPPRLIFGARLDACAREAGGLWVIRFEPDSGVLLTDPGAAASCLPAPLRPDVRETLRRQEGWLHLLTSPSRAGD